MTGTAPGVLTVAVGEATCQVSHGEISNPDGLPARRYVVGWTPAAPEAAP